MADHIEEDEQLEALKRWWAQNGLPIGLAVVLGLGGWFAWQSWQSSRHEKSTAGSLVYLQMIKPLEGAHVTELTEDQIASIAESAQLLKAEHGGRQYGALAGLMLAKLAVSRDDFEAAIAELEWVVEGSKDEALADLARLRLVRVLSAAERYDEALALAGDEASEAMVSGLAEARGDIYFLRGDMVAARAAYQAALDGLTPGDATLKPLLDIKLNQVLPADPEMPVEDSGAGATEAGVSESSVGATELDQSGSGEGSEKEVIE